MFARSERFSSTLLFKERGGLGGTPHLYSGGQHPRESRAASPARVRAASPLSRISPRNFLRVPRRGWGGARGSPAPYPGLAPSQRGLLSFQSLLGYVTISHGPSRNKEELDTRSPFKGMRSGGFRGALKPAVGSLAFPWRSFSASFLPSTLFYFGGGGEGGIFGSSCFSYPAHLTGTWPFYLILLLISGQRELPVGSSGDASPAAPEGPRGGAEGCGGGGCKGSPQPPRVRPPLGSRRVAALPRGHSAH